MGKYCKKMTIVVVIMLVWTGSTLAQDDYTYILKWGTYGTDDGEFRYPNGICIDNQDYVYVSDGGYNYISNHRIQKFLSDGTFIDKWGSQGSEDGQFQNRVMGMVTDSQHIYVADMDNHRIQKFSLDGIFISKWGSHGSGDGQFIAPNGITIDDNNNIYVTDSDYGLSRIQKFTSNSVYTTKWSISGSPRGVAYYAGHLYVARTLNHLVSKYDTNGIFIKSWGGHGSGDGQFSYPNGLTCDNLGFVYVCDQHNHRIQKFTSDGTFVTKWGSPGSGDGQLASPWYLTVDNEGFVYVCEGDNHRVQKFGVVPTSDLVLYLPFDEGVGDTAYDQSPYGHHGTIYGATWVDGISGKALAFDGADDYVRVDHTSILNVQAITITCWVNMATGEVNSYGSPVHKRGCYHIDIQNTRFCGNLNTWGLPGDHWLYDGYLLPEQWYFLTLTYVNGDSMRLYVDAEPVATRECDSIINQTYLYDLFIAKRQEGDRHFEGSIDEVRIYNRALSHDEIVDLYNSISQYGSICGWVTDQYNGLPTHDVVMDLYNSSGDTLLTFTTTDSTGFYEFLGYPIDGDTHKLNEGEHYLIWMILPDGYCTHDSMSKTAVVPAEVNFTAYVCEGSYARSMGYWKHQVNVALKGKVHDYTETELLAFLDTIHNEWDYFNNVFTLEDMKDVFTVNQGGSMADRAAQHLLALELNVVSGKISEEALVDLGALSDAITVGEAILDAEGILLDPNSNDPDYEKAKDIAEMLNNMEGYVGGGPQSGGIVSIPTLFELSQNYPNPFSLKTYIPYTLSKRSHVTLKIYNAAGQLVNTLVDQVLEPGYYIVVWDRKDRFRHHLASGIYFYRLSTGEFASTKSMILLR